MSKVGVRRHIGMEKSKGYKELKENPVSQTQNPNPNPTPSLYKHFKKVYPLGIYRSNSLLSMSSLASSVSQNSSDSSLTDSSSCPLDQKIVLSLESLRRVRMTLRRRDTQVVAQAAAIVQSPCPSMGTDHESAPWAWEVKRCHWITKNSDKTYVAFHDEQWGVPVYDDNRLFELLVLSGLLMDYNWTEILKRKEFLREAFNGYDPNNVANMGEKEITEISSNKEMGLAECRARCIIENARAIQRVVEEHGSFSGYIWEYFNYKPIINKYRYPRSVPLRSPKSEAISKELIRVGFRLVGPVIVHSFMQAAGMTVDHLVDCFRYKECVSLAENPWRHI